MALRKDYKGIRQAVEEYVRAIPLTELTYYADVLIDKMDDQVNQRTSELVLLDAVFKAGKADKGDYSNAEGILAEIAELHDSMELLEEYMGDRVRGRFGQLKLIEGGALRCNEDVKKEEKQSPKTGTED